MPNDPLYNDRDSASRDLIRYGIIYDNFGTNFPLVGLLKDAGVTEVLFQGTGLEHAYIYDYAYGNATQPGDTITPQRKQMASDTKFDERFYQSNLPIDQTTYKLYNAPGDTQKFSQEDLDTYCMMKKIESMIEMDFYRHGQPASGAPGAPSTTGVSDNRWKTSNGFDEMYNNGIDPGPFGNVYTYYGYQKRNGVVGQAQNSVPYYCGQLSGTTANPGSITYPVLEHALAQLAVLGAKARVGFANPFGYGALAVMFRSAAVIQHLQVTEGTDFGWRSVNFGGITIHEDPLAPSSTAWNYLPGGNPAAYGTSSQAKFLDGAGSNTKLVPFVSPTYTVNGASVSAGTLSPTGSNIPSGSTINPGECLWFTDPETLVLTPPKPGSGWEWDDRIVPIPNNVSTDNRFLKLATNFSSPQPTHGMIIFGFRSI
jgi:hypothetical protein